MNYYIYFIYEIDSVNPFYVGKGKGRRLHDHLQPRRLKKNTFLYNKLRSMIKKGEEFTIQIVMDGLTESEAFVEEMYFIQKFGRRDIDTGCLCNMTNGGDGVSGLIHSEEHRLKLSISRRNAVMIHESR